MFFSIQILIKKYWKIDFSAFGKILVLVNAIFYANSNKKSIEKLIFPAFGKSWFWRMLFSIQILIKKVLKN